MSAVGLVLGAAAYGVARRHHDRVHDVMAAVGSVLAGASFLLGAVALVLADTVAAEALLIAFMASILVVWGVEMLHHAWYLRSGSGGVRVVHR